MQAVVRIISRCVVRMRQAGIALAIVGGYTATSSSRKVKNTGECLMFATYIHWQDGRTHIRYSLRYKALAFLATSRVSTHWQRRVGSGPDADTRRSTIRVAGERLVAVTTTRFLQLRCACGT